MDEMGNQASLLDKERNNKIDCMKGILIFLVVFGHAIQYGSGKDFFSGECYFGDILFKVIYSFHMPCFGILSGFLYYRYVRERSFVKKLQKIWKLFMPMAGFAVVNIVISLCNKEISATVPAVLKSYIWLVCYNWWFIWSIIICYVFWGILEGLHLRERTKIALAFCIQILIVVLPNRGNWPLYGFIFLYFLIGYYMEMLLRLFDKLNGKWKKIIKYSIVALWIICVVFYQYRDYIYTSMLSIHKEQWLEQLGVDLFRWGSGIFGSLTFLGISNRLIEKIPSRILIILSFAGRNSIYIYILSGYFSFWILKIIEVDKIPIHYIFNFTEAISIMTICCVIIYISKKIKQGMKKLTERIE